MKIDFSFLKNNENLLFILIVFLIAVVAVAILVFVIVSVLKLIKDAIKKIFQKNEDLEYSQDFEPVVPELEESKRERQEIAEKKQEFGKASTHGPKMQYINIGKSGKESEVEKNQKQTFDEKGEKNIEEGLDALKKSGKDGEVKEENSGIFQKIKIPRAKRVIGGDTIGSVKSEAEEKKSDDYQSVSIGKTSVIQNDRLEMLRGAEIKIPKTGGAGEVVGNKAPVLGEGSVFSEIHNKIGKTEPKIPGDNSIFGGESEVSRIDLRQKLRKDPKVWMAGKQVGLTLNPTERANLEKEVFSQTYGRNISKSDLRGGIKKLNQKMLSTKNLAEKVKIRDKIEFFKKIGGVK